MFTREILQKRNEEENLKSTPEAAVEETNVLKVP